MTKLFLSLYYLVFTYLFFRSAHFSFNVSAVPFEFAMFARPFSELLSLSFSFPVLFILGVFSSIACALRPHILLRIFVSSLFIILVSLKSSYGKINHQEHIWMLTSVLLCFIADKQPLINFRNLLVLRLMQMSLLGVYFTSGLWKFRALGFSNWGEAALEHIAYAIGEGGGPGVYVLQLLTQGQSWIFTAGFSLVLLFQLSSAIPLITLRFFKSWGVAALLFHLSTGIGLGIWFHPQVLAVLLILIFSETLIEHESSDSLAKRKEAAGTHHSTNGIPSA